jgi:hypothetical protein
MRKISVPKGVELVFSTDFHSHDEQFFKLINLIKPSEKAWFVSGADYLDKGYGDESAFLIIDKMIEMSYLGYGFSVLGNHDQKFKKKNKNVTNPSPQLSWIRTLPLSLTFEFYTGALVTVVHGGIRPSMTWEDLQTNTEVMYIRDLDKDERMIQLLWKEIDGVKTLVPAKPDGKSWHHYYQGQYGYICSGHAANYSGEPKFYNYSLNLDCAVFETGILAGQYFTAEGKLGELITVSGIPAKPKLNIQQ